MFRILENCILMCLDENFMSPYHQITLNLHFTDSVFLVEVLEILSFRFVEYYLWVVTLIVHLSFETLNRILLLVKGKSVWLSLMLLVGRSLQLELRILVDHVSSFCWHCPIFFLHWWIVTVVSVVLIRTWITQSELRV